MPMTTIAAVGVGAVGGAIAADLAEVERQEVQLCTRTPIDTQVEGESYVKWARAATLPSCTP